MRTWGRVRPLFTDRADAGVRLGKRLREMSWRDPVVLGLARGGVAVAAKVAEALDAPLDVAVARKIGAPGNPEFGLGAVTADAPARYDESVLAALGLTTADLQATCERERAVARDRVRRYRQGRDPLPITDMDVVLVDDGLATGVTARAALGQLRAAKPRRLVFAAPVCARDSEAALRAEATADAVVCLHAPADFGAVGVWYQDFAQVSDAEVLAILARARAEPPPEE